MTTSVANICANLGVKLVAAQVNRSPGASKCTNVMDRILWLYGEDHLVLVLRTIMGSEANRMALVTPVLWAVSDLIRGHPEWAQASRWLEAFGAIDLLSLFERSRTSSKKIGMSRRATIAADLGEILTTRLGRPAAATGLPKRKSRPIAKAAKAGPKQPASEAPPKPSFWAALAPPEVCAEEVQRILISHDRLDIEATARAKLERLLRYSDECDINLLIVTIIESDGNENALIAPVIEAVHSVMIRHRAWTEMGSKWLEAFDQLPPLLSLIDDMRALDLFHEKALGKYLGMILINKLGKHFETSTVEPPPPTREPDCTAAR